MWRERPSSSSTVRFMSFFAMPLVKFPETFGLTELKKGFFPHLFKTPEHQEYLGLLPNKTYYMPEGMKLKNRAEFD